MSDGKAGAGDWLALINPAVKFTSPEQANRSLRLSAIAIGVHLLMSVISYIWTSTHMAELRAYTLRVATANLPADAPPEAGEMMRSAMEMGLQLGLVGSIVSGFIFLVIFCVQWARPTGWIPLVLAILSGIGLLSLLRSVPMMISNPPPTPMALTITSSVLTVLSLGVYIAAFRAKRYLTDRKDAAAA